MRFSDDPCYHCEGNRIINVKYYKKKVLKLLCYPYDCFKRFRKKVLKLLCYPYRCFKRFCFKDLEQREIKLSNQIQELNKFKHVNVDAIDRNTFNNIEKWVASMQNRINKLVVPDDFTEEFQFIFDLKHDLKEFVKYWNQIRKLPKGTGDN